MAKSNPPGKNTSTRMERGSKATLLTVEQIAAYCKEHNIGYETNFIDIVTTKPDGASNRDAFMEAHDFGQLPPTTLKEKGASTIIVLESKKENHHGEVVAAIADAVGKGLNPDVETVYIKASINPNYRRKNKEESQTDAQVAELMKHQGAAVIHTSIGWDDETLGFGSEITDVQLEEMRNIAAFVTDSTGNDGKFGFNGKFVPIQKHNAVSHFTPLIMHIGAAAKSDDGSYHVEGYSSANGPGLVAPLNKDMKVNWGNADKGLEPITGSSASAPVVSGIMAALNGRYGAYLPREYIMYAAFATSTIITEADKDAPKTPEAYTLNHVTNAAGLKFDPEYSGFGLAQPHRMDKLLSAMVAYAQKHPELVSIPEEYAIDFSTDAEKHPKNAEGKYTYVIESERGTALKNELWVDFQKKIGKVELTSPSGTTVPMYPSRHLTDDRKYATTFGLATTHAFAGEEQEGKWQITSTEPISTLRMYTTHFRSQDMIREIDVPTVMREPTPDLSHAKPLKELLNAGPTWVGRITHEMQHQKRLSVGGKKLDFASDETILEGLKKLPSGLAERTRTHTPINYMDEENPGWQAEVVAYQLANAGEKTPENSDAQVAAHLKAAEIYSERGEGLAHGNVLSLAAQVYRAYPEFELQDGRYAPEAAAELFERAIAVHVKLEHWDHAYRDTDQLYGALTDTIRAYKNTGDADKVEELLQKLEGVRKQALLFSEQMQGTPDAEAWRVEEGEAGFSRKTRIGTDNTSQCLTLFVQEPISKKTGVVHIDYENSLVSLKEFFAQFPPEPLQARVIGARFKDDERSLENVANVMRAIKNHRVDIISADIWAGDAGPSAAVVDPQTFTLKEAVPAAENPNRHLSNAIVLFTGFNKSVLTDFDLTISPERAPLLLPEGAPQFIREHYLGKDEEQIDDVLYKDSVADRALMTTHLLALMQAYEAAYAPINAALEQRIEQLGEEGIMVDNESTIAAKKLLESTQIYIGSGADNFNQPIIEAIAEDLLVISKGQQVRVNARAITDVELSTDAYATIRAEHGESAPSSEPDRGRGRG